MNGAVRGQKPPLPRDRAINEAKRRGVRRGAEAQTPKA